MSLRKERICAAKSCNKTEAIVDGEDESKSELRWCRQCKIVRYCSETCQEFDFKTHKKNCKEVSVSTKEVRTSEDRLLAWEGRTLRLYKEMPNCALKCQMAICGSRTAFSRMVECKWRMVKECESWEPYQAAR
jgi:hypothetical protein